MIFFVAFFALNGQVSGGRHAGKIGTDQMGIANMGCAPYHSTTKHPSLIISTEIKIGRKLYRQRRHRIQPSQHQAQSATASVKNATISVVSEKRFQKLMME